MFDVKIVNLIRHFILRFITICEVSLYSEQKINTKKYKNIVILMEENDINYASVDRKTGFYNNHIMF